MKRYLVMGALAVFGALFVVATGVAYHFLLEPLLQSAPTESASVQRPPKPLRLLPDVDALARRLPYNQSVYTQLRDEALADYARNQTAPLPSDDEARGTLKLFAYLCVWDDFYGEGLWTTLFDHANHLISQGRHDQIWRSMRDIYWFGSRHSNDDANATQLSDCCIHLEGETWPAIFRLRACETALSNLVYCKTDPKIQPPLVSSLQAMPDLTARVVACYRELIRAHVTHAYLFREGEALLDDAQDDEPTLIQLSKGFDQVFEAEDRGNPQEQVLDGEFYISDAWNARGNGYANTVSQDSWRLFGERLQRAEAILTEIYGRTPQEPGVARSMMTVVLGEQQPRGQMEQWFQRGQNVDGDLFDLYTAKRCYLLPRWYGSDEDVWNFGLECSQSTKWAEKIPIAMVGCISDRGDNDPTVYARPEIWQPLEKTFRDFLAHYPDSVHYRSLFALFAAQGGHWDVAKEQFQLLGANWDPDVFPDKLYDQTISVVNAH